MTPVGTGKHYLGTTRDGVISRPKGDNLSNWMRPNNPINFQRPALSAVVIYNRKVRLSVGGFAFSATKMSIVARSKCNDGKNCNEQTHVTPKSMSLATGEFALHAR